MRKSKAAGLTIFYLLYAAAYAVGYAAGMWVEPFLLRMLVMDGAATVFIWLVSLFLRNSSLYDAYWSLTPLVMAVYAVGGCYRELNGYHWVFLAVFCLWSVRLTVNWSVTFENMDWEDWRYRKFRELPPPLWHLANFFGIMLVPTLCVFAGMLSVFALLALPAGPASLVGSAVVVWGIALETAADRQMHAFLRSDAHRGVCRVGLWKYSRHPNYLGEISIWVGAYLAAVLSGGHPGWLAVGPAVMVALFLAVSIPLSEGHHRARRPEYEAYRRTTSMLLLLPGNPFGGRAAAKAGK